jgi:hypothetical protein
LVIAVWDLFGIWNLVLGILKTLRLKALAIISVIGKGGNF